MPPRTSKTAQNDPDLVDRIFEYLLKEFPHLDGPKIFKAKSAVRSEFSGERPYIPSKSQRDRAELAMSILEHFNGRNATEVARRLGIGRTTVYRLLKQAGHKDRPTFAVSGTPPAIRSDAATPIPSEPFTWPLPNLTLTPSTEPSPAANSRSSTTAAR